MRRTDAVVIVLMRAWGLSRNSCEFTLGWGELEAKVSGLFVEPGKDVALVLFFIVAFSGFDVGGAMFEHPVEQTGQFVGERFDRFGRTEPRFQPAAIGTERGFALEGGGGAQAQEVRGTVMAFDGNQGKAFAPADLVAGA